MESKDKEKLLDIIVGVDSMTKKEISLAIKEIILSKVKSKNDETKEEENDKEENDKEESSEEEKPTDEEILVEIFGESRMKNVCCLPSICVGNKCNFKTEVVVKPDEE